MLSRSVPRWALLAFIATLVLAPRARADEGRCSPVSWVATWSAAMQAPLFAPAPTYANQTLREIVHISLGGDAVRVRFSNVIGTAPFTINAASVGIRASGASVAAGTLRPLTFGGAASITIPRGAIAVSDAVALPVADQADLAISLYVVDASLASTQLTLAHQTSYVGAGDQTESAGFTATGTTTSWFWLSGVDVHTVSGARAIVAFGDSITEGFNSTTDANARWPDVLARRVLARGHHLSVVDEAISGNRVLNDEIGPNAQARLDRDMLVQTGAAFAIVLEGINDIGFSQIPPGVFPPSVLLTNVSADEIIAGYEQIIRRAHDQGLRIFGGTLTPFEGAFYADAAGEAKREAVNLWIRTSGAFDAVIDFDAAVQDPADPLRLNPAYDSGDHLHPNDAGYAVMGQTVDLKLFNGCSN